MPSSSRIHLVAPNVSVLTGNPHDAADLVQEALVRLRGSWSRVRRKNALDGYVRTTMTRLHINSWRMRRREHITATPPDSAYEDAPYEGSGLWRTLSKLRGDLPEIVENMGYVT